MANVSTYSWSNGSFEPSIGPLYQFSPSACDRRLVTTTTCAAFATLDPSVSLVWWSSSGGGFMVRFGAANAPSPACGMFFTGGASAIWSSSMAACARFISQNATPASIAAILLV